MSTGRQLEPALTSPLCASRRKATAPEPWRSTIPNGHSTLNTQSSLRPCPPLPDDDDQTQPNRRRAGLPARIGAALPGAGPRPTTPPALPPPQACMAWLGLAWLGLAWLALPCFVFCLFGGTFLSLFGSARVFVFGRGGFGCGAFTFVLLAGFQAVLFSGSLPNPIYFTRVRNKRVLSSTKCTE